MKNLFAFLLIINSSTALFAQNKYHRNVVEFDNKEAKISTPNTILATKNISSEVENYIRNAFPSVKYGDFILRHHTQSQASNHYLFQQYYKNLEVYRGSIKISVNKSGKISSVLNFAYELPDEALYIIKSPNIEQYLSQKYGNEFPIKSQTKEVYYVKNHQLHKGTLLNYSSTYSYIGDKEVLFNADGKEIYENDNMVYHSHASQQDTLVKVKIFRPDPLASANVTYGGSYVDANDTDVAVINAELVDTTMFVKFENDTFYLKSNYINLGEFDLPIKAICKTLTDTMHYTRANDCFEQVSVFFYINYFQNYLQSLGFNNLGNHAINVDAHGWNGQDNSSFSPSEDLLSFGEGGVDDAEDLDVILHEYQHALAYYAAPGTNSGNERRCLDEANGDYLAASYSKSVENHTWDNVFTWDGHNEFWQGRKATSAKVYSSSLSFSNIYAQTDLWAGTLMQIWEDIGRETTDKILMESLYAYSAGLKMNQAAKLFLLADSNLHNGANAIPIITRFCAKNLLTTECSIISVDKKLKNIPNTHPTVYFNANEIVVNTDNNFDFNLITIDGKGLLKAKNQSNNNSINISDLPSGVYMLQLTIKDNKSVHKVVK
jgi:hypothetical protein